MSPPLARAHRAHRDPGAGASLRERARGDPDAHPARDQGQAQARGRALAAVVADAGGEGRHACAGAPSEAGQPGRFRHACRRPDQMSPEKWGCAAHDVDHHREARVPPLEPSPPVRGPRCAPRRVCRRIQGGRYGRSRSTVCLRKPGDRKRRIGLDRAHPCGPTRSSAERRPASNWTCRSSPSRSPDARPRRESKPSSWRLVRHDCLPRNAMARSPEAGRSLLA